MDLSAHPAPWQPRRLADVVSLDAARILNPGIAGDLGGLDAASVVLVLLAAGKGTRFGPSPKCIQLVGGKPLARHSIDAFRHLSLAPAVCVVGHEHRAVAEALGADNVHVLSINPTGGTAHAVYEAFSVEALLRLNPLVVVAMGDRVVTRDVFARLIEIHRAGVREADITFLAAVYARPRQVGKGRVVRDGQGRAVRIIEQRDIDALADAAARSRFDEMTEANCPLYAGRAATFHRYLGEVTDGNAQRQFYLTDIVEAISRSGGDVRTLTLGASDPAHALLCTDVTRPSDLAQIETLLDGRTADSDSVTVAVEAAAQAVFADRPPVQVEAIAGQIEGLIEFASGASCGFRSGEPVALGIAGGRLRIAFMHPDMGRFFGPAWQMPIGAGAADGTEQILVLAQAAEDGRLHLFPSDPKYRESVDSLPGDAPELFPGESVSDCLAYEVFGTRLSESLLRALGYFTDEEVERCRARGDPLPPGSRWIRNNLRRPFPLVANAIASLRTLRAGAVGRRVQSQLGRDGFRGLRLATLGAIPQGGFASSSALTLATKNALNALFGLGLDADTLVQLACQAEYGTGVRAGSLDQATEQKGRPGCGTLISSNPKDNYRVLGTHPVPADRFRILFPYTVERDINAWRWSWGAYGESSSSLRLTTGEFRKLTGKAAEMAALLLGLPLGFDFFDPIQEDLISDGGLEPSNRSWIASVLQAIPALIGREELRGRLEAKREWLVGEIARSQAVGVRAAESQAERTLSALFAGWRDPVLRRPGPGGEAFEETGVPLRAIVAYLFAEVARNFRLIHEPDRWIHWVTWSQRGDRCFNLEPDRLPSGGELERVLEWERGFSGPGRLDHWMEAMRATPFDYQAGLEDDALAADPCPRIECLPGGNFFRGLALVDLAEAMLHRAFGAGAVAVRVNAAGQGDFFQVHVDTRAVSASEVQRFMRAAFFRRFEIAAQPDFVSVHPGGGAVGLRLDRFEDLGLLARRLRQAPP